MASAVRSRRSVQLVDLAMVAAWAALIALVLRRAGQFRRLVSEQSDTEGELAVRINGMKRGWLKLAQPLAL